MALSLLPQRRHRKMLRDGSSEVWPEDAERIFLDGLRLYWASPWANFSRGRSRWRNQFLVDHLNKHNIVRTKKQVASHIQVLRNMWKGHPEFSLVAGPDEPNDDLGSPSRTSRSTASTTTTTTSTSSSLKRRSSISSTPSSSRSHDGSESSSSSPMKSEFSPTLEPPSEVDFLVGKTRYANRVCGLCLWAEGMDPNYINVDGLSLNSSQRTPPPPPATPAQQIRTSLRIRLTVPSASHGATGVSRADPSNPNHPLTHEASRGFNGAVLFPFNLHNAKVVTKVQMADGSINIEKSAMQALNEPYASNFTQLSHPRELRDARSPRLSHHSDSKSSRSSTNGTGAPTARSAAILPNSFLTRCRWMDPDFRKTIITQEIMIADDVVFVVVYDMERTSETSITSPRAELVNWTKVYDPEQQQARNQPSASLPPNGYPSLNSNYAAGMMASTHGLHQHQHHHQNAMSMSNGYTMSPTSPTSPVGATHFVNAFAPYSPTTTQNQQAAQQPRSTQQVFASYGTSGLFNSNSAYSTTSSAGISPSQLQLGPNGHNNSSKTGSYSANGAPGSNNNQPDPFAAPFYSSYNSEFMGFSGLNINSLGSLNSSGGMDNLNGGLNGGLGMGLSGVGMEMNGLNSMLNGGLSGDQHWQQQSGSNSGSGSGAGSTPSPGAGGIGSNSGSAHTNGGQALMSFF